MNIRDLSTLERTATWLEELITLCQPRGRLCDADRKLVADVGNLKAEVLKVPHHGSRYSLPSFLAAVAPRVALVSVGAGNTYGHPSKSTMDSLKALGALVTRTDVDGDTAVVADSAGLAIARRGEPRGPPRR